MVANIVNVVYQKWKYIVLDEYTEYRGILYTTWSQMPNHVVQYGRLESPKELKNYSTKRIKN